MKIILNGDEKTFEAPLTVQQLLETLQVPAGRVACEINLKIIRRANYAQTVINEGDTVEIIQAIGGG